MKIPKRDRDSLYRQAEVRYSVNLLLGQAYAMLKAEDIQDQFDRLVRPFLAPKARNLFKRDIHKELLAIYDWRANGDSDIASLPRRIGENLHALYGCEYGNSPGAIARKLRRALIRRAEEEAAEKEREARIVKLADYRPDAA